MGSGGEEAAGVVEGLEGGVEEEETRGVKGGRKEGGFLFVLSDGIPSSEDHETYNTSSACVHTQTRLQRLKPATRPLY